MVDCQFKISNETQKPSKNFRSCLKKSSYKKLQQSQSARIVTIQQQCEYSYPIQRMLGYKCLDDMSPVKTIVNFLHCLIILVFYIVAVLFLNSPFQVFLEQRKVSRLSLGLVLLSGCVLKLSRQMSQSFTCSIS